MNRFSIHETLWCEADVRFFTRHNADDSHHRKYRPNANHGDLIPRHHGACFADEMQCRTVRIYSPDWSESAEYPNSGGWGKLPAGCFYAQWIKHGHNWRNVTRIDITFTPEDSPFYYYGRLYTGGISSHTLKLRRIKTTHQASHLIPARHVKLTPLDHGITRAEWKERRDPRRYGWDHRSIFHEKFLVRTANGWKKADTFDDALKLQVLERMGLNAA